MKITNAFDGSKAKVGDRVWCCDYDGIWGTIEAIEGGRDLIKVRYDDDRGFDYFYFDGRMDGMIHGSPYYRLPVLYYGPPEIIGPPKPKRMVKKEVRGWSNIYPAGHSSGLYPSKESADSGAAYSGRIACVELTGTYEVEED